MSFTGKSFPENKVDLTALVDDIAKTNVEPIDGSYPCIFESFGLRFKGGHVARTPDQCAFVKAMKHRHPAWQVVFVDPYATVPA